MSDTGGRVTSGAASDSDSPPLSARVQRALSREAPIKTFGPYPPDATTHECKRCGVGWFGVDPNCWSCLTNPEEGR